MSEDRREALLAQAESLMASRSSITAPADRVRLRDAMEARLEARIPDLVIYGRGAPRAPHIAMISVPGTDSESMLMALDLAGVAASAGSA